MRNLKSTLSSHQTKESTKNKDEISFNSLKQMSSPIFTNKILPDINNLNSSQNLISLSFFKKMNLLYNSTLDARELLQDYKSQLCLCSNVENNCLTPLEESSKEPMLFYKREDLTCIHAYKIRGALYQTCKIVKENNNDKSLHFIAASTGNHALGVLKTAEILNLSNVTIYVSENVSKFKREKLERRVFELREKDLNVKLIVKGKTFDKTNKLAQDAVLKNKNTFFIDPYNNSYAVSGQGTIGLELLTQLDKKLSGAVKNGKLKELTVIVPIGGGGLVSGIACAMKLGLADTQYLKSLKLRVIGVKLNDLNSVYGDAIKVKTFGEHNQEFISNLVEKQVLISDADMETGTEFVYSDIGVTVEGASAGTLKPVLENLVKPCESNAVVCILSGSNTLL